MKLIELQVRRFRNLTSIDWQPADGVNLVVGENGQGKTNLLESIYFGLLGRSFRTRREERCLPWNIREAEEKDPSEPSSESTPHPTQVRCQIKGRSGTRQLKVLLERRQKRAWSDGVLIPRLGDLWQGNGVVVFTPSDVELFRGAPSARRSFLDQLMALASRPFFGHLQRYQRGLKQINAALKASAQRQFGLQEAEPFYRGLATDGAALMHLRHKALTDLHDLCAGCYRELDGSGTFQLGYAPNLRTDVGETDEPDRLTEALYDRFRDRHADCVRTRMLDVGPHRDDFRVDLDGRDLGKFGSQGQHRLVTLALKLSAADWLAEGLEDPPLLLLDDFGSELDRRRRDAVLAHLKGRMQTFITATGVETLGDASQFDEVRSIRQGNWV